MQGESWNVLRIEKKYPVSQKVAGQIAARLSYLMRLDEHCKGGRPYIIKTIYFDSLYDKDFREKEDGLETRKKIRMRTYGMDSGIKLEWKQKQGAVQRKRSLLISRTHAEQILRGEYRVLMEYSGDLPMEFYTVMTEEVYRPKCLIQYQRLAYVLPSNDTRVTLDSQISASEGILKWGDYRNPVYPVTEVGKTILEVKYNHFLMDYIKTALAEYHLTETANSKYLAGRYYGFRGNIS